jgi:hypothetical protein
MCPPYTHAYKCDVSSKGKTCLSIVVVQQATFANLEIELLRTAAAITDTNRLTS